jgi:CheY-like chemotaxis protein
MSAPDLAGRHALLVEDDDLLARALGDLLGAWGATVLGPATTAEQALALVAQAERIDVAIVDINLRGETSFAVADTLLAREIPFVIMTGHRASMLPERYQDLAILQKPCSARQIASTLHALTS